MSNYLDTLRAKPKETRAYIALVSATVCTMLLFVVWAIGVPGRVAVPSNNPIVAVEQNVDAPEKEETSTIKRLFGQFKHGAAAAIFNDASDVVVPKESHTPKEIDINALLQQPKQPRPVEITTTSTSTTSNESEIQAGEVILIGTTTDAHSPEKDE